MESELIIRSLAVLVLSMLALVVLIFEEENMARIVRSVDAATASPLSGTKIKQPWVNPSMYAELPVDRPGRRYIPTEYDIADNERPTLTTSGSEDRDYVPPLDGTDSSHLFCQDNYGMRFVLFDLQLLNVDAVDALAGSFTAQFQLVFHWREGWEELKNETGSIYSGDPIETSDSATLCGFYCDSTSQSTMCCDRGWVPPFQLPSCKINNVDSIVEASPWMTVYTGEDGEPLKSFWDTHGNGTKSYFEYDARRVWYVGLEVTCPFTPDFRNFPFDYQFLTLDIVNPYASHTWLQLNRGFLQANIINSIADIDLNPDLAIDGWRMKGLVVSSACGTQQTWAPTLLTQDDLLQFLGDKSYKSQRKNIMDLLNHLTSCAEIKDLVLKKKSSNLGNSANYEPYKRTKKDYLKRLDATIAEYKECTSRSMVEFKWNKSLPDPSDASKIPFQMQGVKFNDNAFLNRSFSFLDFQYPQAPTDGINFECVINAIANLTTPGIRINIIVQRYKMYYLVKLILPTCACVAFSFAAFALDIDNLLGRLTVVVPSAIALSALQGYVVASDIPAVAYLAPTTYVVLLSYGVQLLITSESILLYWIFMKLRRNSKQTSQSKTLSPSFAQNQADEEQHIFINKHEDPVEEPMILGQKTLQTSEDINEKPPQSSTDQVNIQMKQFKIRQSVLPLNNNNNNHDHHHQQSSSYNRDTTTTQVVDQKQLPSAGCSSTNPEVQAANARVVDRYISMVLGALYILSIMLLVLIPLVKARSKFNETKLHLGSEILM